MSDLVTIIVERVKNGFALQHRNEAITVVEGTNPRTVAAKLGRAVIKALFDADRKARKEAA